MTEAYPAVTEAEIVAAYNEAMRYATRQANGRGQACAEALRDAATDGVMKSRGRYDPARSTRGFGPFAFGVVKNFIRRAQRTYSRRLANRPEFGPLTEDLAARDLPEGVELSDLPLELLDAVEGVYIQGLTTREAAKRAGVAKATIDARLRAAAEALAEDGVAEPIRPPGTKRVRGGRGH